MPQKIPTPAQLQKRNINKYDTMLTKSFSFLITALVIVSLQTNGHCEPIEPGEGYITSSDGVRLFYMVVGKGPNPLVALHGGPGNTLFSILPDFEPLAKDHTVIYYDQRGNGRSDLVEESEQLAISKHIEDLEAVRQHFNLNKLTLLGNSWGGLLISFYALKHPDRVEKLILHSPASPSYDILRTSTPYIYQRIPKESMARFQSMSIPGIWRSTHDPLTLCRRFYELLRPVYFSDVTRAEKMRGDVCAAPIEALRRQPAVNKTIWETLGEWNLVPKLASLETPALIIHGSYDMIPVESSIAWTKALPNARLLVINDSGHMTHIEQPDIFFTAVKTFLNGQWPENAIQIPGEIDDDAQPQIEINRP